MPKIKTINAPIEGNQVDFDIIVDQYNVIGDNTTVGIYGYKVKSIEYGETDCQILLDDGSFDNERERAFYEYMSCKGQLIYFEGTYLNYDYLIIKDLKRNETGESIITVEHKDKINLKDIVIMDTTNDPTRNWVYVPSNQLAGELVTGSNSALAAGINSMAFGAGASAVGDSAKANGRASHAEGRNTKATYAAHAEGDTTEANGHYSHAEGYKTYANAARSHTEGYSTYTEGTAAHAEGYDTKAEGPYGSHSEGRGTRAIGIASHAEGYSTIANQEASHAEGYSTEANGSHSHAEGTDTISAGTSSHAEGSTTRANGVASHAEGRETVSEKDYSHAEGLYTWASGVAQHVSGKYNKLDDMQAVIIGNGTGPQDEQRSNAYTLDWDGNAWFAGDVTIGNDKEPVALHKDLIGAHSGGGEIFNDYSNNSASNYSHAEGRDTQADGVASHTEGMLTISSGVYSHAEGWETLAEESASHAEGYQTYAEGKYTHAEGQETNAFGKASHAEGYKTYSGGFASHAEGIGTLADGESQHAGGKYNSSDSNKAVIIGNGHGSIILLEEGFDEGEATVLIEKGWTGYNDFMSTSTKLYPNYYRGTYSLFLQTNDGFAITPKYNISTSEQCIVSLMTLKMDNKYPTLSPSGVATFIFYDESNNEIALYGNDIATGNKYETDQNQKNWQEENISAIAPEGASKFAIKFTTNQSGQYGIDDLKIFISEKRSNAYTLDWEGNARYAGTVETTGFILTSPHNIRFLITIDDNGNFMSNRLGGE